MDEANTGCRVEVKMWRKNKDEGYKRMQDRHRRKKKGRYMEGNGVRERSTGGKEDK